MMLITTAISRLTPTIKRLVHVIARAALVTDCLTALYIALWTTAACFVTVMYRLKFERIALLLEPGKFLQIRLTLQLGKDQL